MIELEKISVQYPGSRKKILKDITAEFHEGEVVLISGKTGSGKSTLAHSICGIIPNIFKAYVEGSIKILNSSPWNQPVWKTSRMLGFLPQNVEMMVFTDTVEDEIAFGLENACLPQEDIKLRITNYMELTGISHLRKRFIRTLSSGELQRVMIASLLALDQKFLILDEPFAFLDNPSRISLASLLCKLAEKGKGIFIIEHREYLLREHHVKKFCLNGGKLFQGLVSESDIPRLGSPVATGDVVLYFHNVDFSWDNDPEDFLLKDVCFQLRAGESVVIQGTNGSGKTTILFLAMGLLRPKKGKVITCGIDTKLAKSSVIAKSATLVLQCPQSQLFMKTVFEEVLSRSKDSETAIRELKNLRLYDLADRHPRSLSTGQMRRLTLACALSLNPRLLLLDEPSVGQDDESLALIIRRLERFINEGGALLTTTHDEKVADALGHRKLVIEHGTVTELRREDHEKSSSSNGCYRSHHTFSLMEHIGGGAGRTGV